METSRDYIKKCRQMLDLTQDEFGRLFGVNGYNISHYERGVAMPPGDLILMIIRHMERRKKRLVEKINNDRPDE